MEIAFVTGANGFVGHHLVNLLISEGYHVVAITRNDDGVDSFCNLSNVELIHNDLFNPYELVDKVNQRNTNAVFYHLAWSGNSGVGREDYALQINNAKSAVEYSEVASILGCKRFVVSGSVTQLMYRDYLYQDCIFPELVACYAIGKTTAEALLKCVCAKHKIELSWAYISNLYGEDDTTQNFINFLIDSYLQRKTPMLTSAVQYADFTHVSDIAKGLLCLGERGLPNTSYYIGYGEPKQLRDYIAIIHEKIAPDIDCGIGKKEFTGLSIDFNSFDYLRLNRDTGFAPSIDFNTGIDQVIMNRRIMKTIGTSYNVHNFHRNR